MRDRIGPTGRAVRSDWRVVFSYAAKRVSTGSSPSPGRVPTRSSTPSSSTVRPSIWYPPQMPMTGTPAARARTTSPAPPEAWRCARSSIVFLVPGRMTQSYPESGAPGGT